MGVVRPDWWCYPERCYNGHEWGPGLIVVSWSLCDCGPPVAASGGHGLSLRRTRPIMPEIVIDRTATPDRRIMILDSFGQRVQMSVDQFRRLAAEGVSDRFRILTSL